MSDANAPKVLMISYACNPDGTGEHWLGWGWAEQAAKKYRVHLITTVNAQAAVEQQSKACGIQPYFVPLSGRVRKWTSPFGRLGAWVRKINWAYRAYRLATDLHQKEKFSLTHQTTFHTFRIPFLATRLGIPSVWGPIAGGEHIPFGFYKFIGPLFLPESLRRVFNTLWLRLPVVQESLRCANIIFASNRTTMEYLGESVRSKCVIVPPNAMRAEDEIRSLQPHVQKNDGTFRLLYVGNCLATRAMPLAFAALARAKISNCRLDILGTGTGLDFWQSQARKYKVTDQIVFHGQKPHKELAAFYENADVLVFPALRDSGGSALLEAMSKGLPVICLDWGGPTEMVDENSGVKIPITTPDETIQRFADALTRLHKDPALRAELGVRAAKRARELFSWDAKRKLLESTYDRLLAEK